MNPRQDGLVMSNVMDNSGMPIKLMTAGVDSINCRRIPRKRHFDLVKCDCNMRRLEWNVRE